MAIDIASPGGNAAALKSALEDSLGVHSVTIRPTSAQLLNLLAVPRPIVAAPGVGLALWPLGAFVTYIYSTAAYVVGEDPFFFVGSDPNLNQWFDPVASLFIRTSSYVKAIKGDLNGQDPLTVIENQPLNFGLTSTDMTTGGGSAVIAVRYAIVPTV